MSIFWKLVDETQMSKPPEATGHHNSIKLLVLLPLKADLLKSIHSEIGLRHPLELIIKEYLSYLQYFIRTLFRLLSLWRNKNELAWGKSKINSIPKSVRKTFIPFF